MIKVKLLVLILCIMHLTGVGQNPVKIPFIKNLEVTGGTKIKVTPIYLEHLYEGVIFYQITPMEQPGLHLSGFGSFFVDEKLKLSNSISVLFHQSVRRDFLVEHFKLGSDYPFISEGVEKRNIYDFYSLILYDMSKNRKSRLYLSMGFGYSGINTAHKVIWRRYTSGTAYVDSTFKKNFSYPTISTGIRWERKKLSAGLIIGYCWNDPTFYSAQFLLPEISFHYRLFSSKKKE